MKYKGKTEKEALENIKEAVQSYLETVEMLSKEKIFQAII